LILPLFFGACVYCFPFNHERIRYIYILAVVCLTSLITVYLNIWGPAETLTLFRFGSTSIAFRIDGLSKIFSFMAAVLWPLATVYAFEYMAHSDKKPRFYAFYTMTYGIILAIAYAANYLTMYLFYELLTLVTLPLVIHHMDAPSYAAGKRYIFYSIGGAGLGFIGLVFISAYGTTLDFHLGGVFTAKTWNEFDGVLIQTFVLAFMGLGVKAALFPASGWLPAASAAPTTVTALLHAAAVVKAGAFVTMRLTYYIFGSDFLWGTWGQQIVMALTLITILAGSARAWYTVHFKRRLAYSTVGQLSYILFGVTLMTPEGLAAAALYMVAHGFIKILLFYCCGAVQHMTRRTEISELAGLGRRMPVTFAAFTLAALALMGTPPAVGFAAKLQLLTAAAESGRFLALIGILIIGISILLTAAYLFPIIRLAYFPSEKEMRRVLHWETQKVQTTQGDSRSEPLDPGRLMTIPLQILAVCILGLGICGRPLLHWMTQIILGPS
jgi:multicomponent Na+:H+ antiporter subunit D